MNGRGIIRCKDALTTRQSGSIEYAPVKHGRWVDDYNEKEHPLFRKAWKCSACGFRTSYGKPKYCMNCGAQMDGESNET